MKVDNNKKEDEFGKKYTEKDHHGKWRKRFIQLQNKYWADLPMSIVGILSLFLIPLFQYCRELKLAGAEHDNQEETERASRMTTGLIWLQFAIGIFFGLEIAIKSYAFGIRRAFTQVNWVQKAEFLNQIAIWILWFLFIFKTNDEDKDAEITILSIGILLRSLRVTSLLNEMEIWRNFARTLEALLKPFFHFSLTLYSLYLIYASVGLEYFGGKIS